MRIKRNKLVINMLAAKCWENSVPAALTCDGRVCGSRPCWGLEGGQLSAPRADAGPWPRGREREAASACPCRINIHSSQREPQCEGEN